jgi:hypothetical protein
MAGGGWLYKPIGTRDENIEAIVGRGYILYELHLGLE